VTKAKRSKQLHCSKRNLKKAHSRVHSALVSAAVSRVGRRRWAVHAADGGPFPSSILKGHTRYVFFLAVLPDGSRLGQDRSSSTIGDFVTLGVEE